MRVPGPSELPPSAQASLEVVERELEQLAQAVVTGTPELLERHAPLFHRAVRTLGDLGARGLGIAEQERLLRCMERLSQVRNNLSRRAAAVERELSILMPDARPGTYRALNPSAARAYRGV